MSARRTVAIVPHTHWDREWYAPFQSFRLRLVNLLDRFLPLLERDLGYARFMLDGQMALVDDYLEVRPEASATLTRLAAAGRLAMGPWYTLPDEFLVSGETHVRNLQLGLERAAAFGGAMEVGYLPDMFGHVAQMPQILAQLGFAHAVVWRGVPAAVDRTAFWWEAPDGSRVRAQYLARGGYGNGAAIPDDAKALVGRVAAHEAELGEMLVGGVLLMNGTDHQVPQPWLGRVAAEANDIQDGYDITVTSLAEFLASPAAPVDGLATWRGELRSGARANLLMGVTSNRVDVRQAVARTERWLERLAEPLAALFLPEWPGALLDVAWREVIRNAAHDSVCACSADEVVDAVVARYASARQIAEGLAMQSLVALGATLPSAASGAGRLFVTNPSARRRGGVVEVVLGDTAPVVGTQVLHAREERTDERLARPSDVSSLLGAIAGRRLHGGLFVNHLRLEAGDDLERDAGGQSHPRGTGPGGDEPLPVVSIRLGAEPDPAADIEGARRAVYEHLGDHRGELLRIRTTYPPVQRLLARVEPVDGFGWVPFDERVVSSANPVRAEGTVVANGLVAVEVDPATGTFALDGVAGYDLLVDGGDAGDTYNWCPPASDSLVTTPGAVSVAVAEAGPVRAALVVTRRYTWPERVDGTTSSRAGEVGVEVATRIEVHADDPLVRVTTSFDNRCRDHRLRTMLPLRHPATTSEAECAFAVVERGLEAEGGASEAALPTFPSRRFVRAGGLTVVHEGLNEYEVVDGGRTLALTLLRATGYLSRGPMATRAEPAGPVMALRGSQVPGPVEMRYALCTRPVDPYALVDDAFLPLFVVTSTGPAASSSRPPRGAALSIEGAEVSAVRRMAGGLEVRVFNPSAAPTTVRLEGCRGWLVDLRGRPLQPFDGSFDLGPWRIATARLDG